MWIRSGSGLSNALMQVCRCVNEYCWLLNWLVILILLPSDPKILGRAFASVYACVGVWSVLQFSPGYSPQRRCLFPFSYKES